MVEESSPGVVRPALRGTCGPPPDWLSGCRGLFSDDGPLPRVFFPSRSGMAEFDSIRMILAKCNLQSEWAKHVRPDGSLFYLDPEPHPDPDRGGSGSGTAGPYNVLRRRDSGIEDDLMRRKRKSNNKIVKCVLRTLLRKRNGVKGQYTNGINGEKTTAATVTKSNYAESQRFHVRLKVDPSGGGNLLDGVFPIEKLTRVDWLSEDRSNNHCCRKRVFVEDLPEYGALTRLSNLRRGDCISALNDISVTRGNLHRLLAAVSQPMEVILTIERSQKTNLRMRNAVLQLGTVPESSGKDEAHAQQNGSVFSSKWSNVDPRRQDGQAEMLIMKD